MKRFAPAAARNRDPILDVLRRLLPQGSERSALLEIASGSGEHAVHFAAGLPYLDVQPSDRDDEALASVEAHRREAALPNLRAPIWIDASSSDWPIDRADAIVAVNMIHISPWRAAEGLFEGAARILSKRGLLVTYGPYRFSGSFTAESNASFDASLKARDPSWGVRDVDDLDALAKKNGFARVETIAMPANNHVLVWSRIAASVG